MPVSKQSSKIRHKGSTIEKSQILIIAIEISTQPWAFLLSRDRISLRTFSLLMANPSKGLHSLV